MSMPSDMDMSGMDMDSTGSESLMGMSQLANAKITHVMTRTEMVADGVEQATEVKSDSSNHLSSCPHDACSQMAISALWVSAHHFQPNFLHWIATNFSRPAGLLPTLYSTSSGTPPPEIPPRDRLVITLRI